MGKGDERLQEPEDQDSFYELVPSTYDREDATTKSQQYGHLNKTCMMTIPVGMPTGMGRKSYKVPSLDEGCDLGEQIQPSLS